MVEVIFVEQLVNSMEEAILKLEKEILKKNFEEATKLKTLIFDLHLQIEKALGGKDVWRFKRKYFSWKEDFKRY